MVASCYTWERRPFQFVPPRSEAAARAREVRTGLLPERWDAPFSTLNTACEAAGVAVLSADLGAATGGLQGLLIPLPGDRFRAVVDPVPCGGFSGPAATRQIVRRHRVRFRIAHELGHTFFFWRQGGRPRRCLRDSFDQERFCDRFAAELLLPFAVAAATEPVPLLVERLAESYGVSLHLAVRTVASAHGNLPFGLWCATRRGLILQASNGVTRPDSASPIAGGRQLLTLGG